MKLLDKLKNALFEEEYVEVEEKPKRKEIKKEKPRKETFREKVKEEKPIAKKIVQAEKKEPKKIVEEPEELEDEYLGEVLADKTIEEKDFKFPMMNDNDFEMDDEVLNEKPKKKEVIATKIEKEEEQKLYQGKKRKESKPYGLDDIEIPEHEYGAYEKHEEKTYFKPSPIISPIYGVLDKNYKKEEIIPKKEIRLTSSYARENINVDDVRRKAYGTLADDINLGVDDKTEYEEDLEVEIEEDSKLLDLSADTDTPEVKKVTMGDAEEYFEDLGLEYNVDYKDTSKSKATGRRTKEEYSEEKDDEGPKIIEETVKVAQKTPNEDADDDNLFDLIDSMYDKE